MTTSFTTMRLLVGLVAVFLTSPTLAQTETVIPGQEQTDTVREIVQGEAVKSSPVDFLKPIPADGRVPPLYHGDYAQIGKERSFRAKARKYVRQIELIRRKYFGNEGTQKLRRAGIAQLIEFTDPSSFRLLITVLEQQDEDVRTAVFDHLSTQGDAGQAALAWAAIHERDQSIRERAIERLTSPLSDEGLHVLDTSLRSQEHAVANAASGVVARMNVTQAIPLLIFAQVDAQPRDGGQRGDLAWIAIQTQRAFVSGLQPVTGDASGGFQPIISTVSDGSVLRVMDAVVIVYRTEVHNTLVSLTTRECGQPTNHLGYDPMAWTEWFNNEFLSSSNRPSTSRVK